MNFDGKWQATIATPIGKQSVVFEITTDNGAMKGTARQGDAIVKLEDLAADGKRLTWSQSVTKPLRLNLKFDVTVEGNVMSGTAKAGRFPASTLTGERLPE